MSSKEFEREGMVGDKELVEYKEKWENRVGDDGKNDYYTDILLNKKPGPDYCQNCDILCVLCYRA
jgi:hypothetical protein